ncbi:MAG: TRAP transporter large permease subunit [Deltaproteobacteria bacterium]|nr:TRAP transporter large permease subunit [Deltaproteobacteria bacterium]
MDSAFGLSLIIVGLIFFFLASGMWISVGLAGVGVIIIYFMIGSGMGGMIRMTQFNIINEFILAAIPLFIFMGSMLYKGKIADKIYTGLQSWVSLLPGGLLQTNILSCAVFGACSGSSLAGAATMGTMAIQGLQQRGYNRKMIYGSLAAGGTLSSMIPPSIAFIVYGAWVGESVGQLFIAGIIPGLILASLFMLYIAIAALINPRVAPVMERPPLRRMIADLKSLLPPILLIFTVLGSIYLGFATPTESAAVGSVMALILTAIDKNLSWRVIKEAGEMTVRTTSMVMLLIIGAQIISMGVSMLRLPTLITEWVLSLNVDKIMIAFFICILYIILGCLIEGTCVLLLTLPVVYPLMMALDFDSIWLGVMMALFIEMGLITPPVGLNLYIIHGVSGEPNMSHTVKGALPFFVCMCVLMVLLIFYPQIATYLPGKMYSVQ